MKNAIYSLLLLLTITACSKNDDPKPAAEVQGNWTLTSTKATYEFLGQKESDDFDFEGDGLYLNLKEGNKFESNMSLDVNEDSYFIQAAKYESTYKVQGNTLTLDFYSAPLGEYIPYVAKIEKSTSGELSLLLTKKEVMDMLNEANKHDDFALQMQMINVLTSFNFQMNFTK